MDGTLCQLFKAEWVLGVSAKDGKKCQSTMDNCCALLFLAIFVYAGR